MRDSSVSFACSLILFSSCVFTAARAVATSSLLDFSVSNAGRYCLYSRLIALIAAALSDDPDLAFRTAERSWSVLRRSSSIFSATSLYDSESLRFESSRSFCSWRCSFHRLSNGDSAAVSAPSIAMTHPTGPSPALRAPKNSFAADAAALKFPTRRFLTVEYAIVAAVAPLSVATSSARAALLALDQKFFNLSAAISASFAAVRIPYETASAAMTPFIDRSSPTSFPMTPMPTSARSIAPFITGMSFWPISTTSS